MVDVRNELDEDAIVGLMVFVDAVLVLDVLEGGTGSVEVVVTIEPVEEEVVEEEGTLCRDDVEATELVAMVDTALWDATAYQSRKIATASPQSVCLTHGN